ncbi:Protein GAMETE EXPRESSED 3 [Rhynchospora pubera]|uniref:Protein GAMETE EXPRESSED 3 n=1 Tax=Rhynchospora pubera TaxID=906938 RepID=A0AAV8DJJ4_9POAL|nr:Protein GAMETE EXPRESSED 3 [Rhynchospora pubera]
MSLSITTKIQWTCCLFLALVALSHSNSIEPSNFFATSNSNETHVFVKHPLGAPLIIQDGRLVACSRRNLYAFEGNGSVAWIVPLVFSCREDIAPVTDDRGKIYLIAENTVLEINPSRIGSFMPPSKALYSHNSSEEILGLSISPEYLSIFITIRNRGLFSFFLRDIQWSIGPTLQWLGYTQGCMNDPLNCYYNSAPVVDLCEGTLYVSNTDGQLYSVYIRNPQFRWIQDLGMFGTMMVITPGNNGLVYATFSKQAIVVCLDAFTGNITWQQTVGPLSSEMLFPLVDSNGWISIGSLDGALYSISPTGDLKKLLEETPSESVIQASPTLDCSGFAVYTSQTRLDSKIIHNVGSTSYVSGMKPVQVRFTLLAPATGTVYWTGDYPGEVSDLLLKSDLQNFIVDERILLAFLSSGRIGNTLQCYTTGQRTSWTCSQAEPKFPTTNSGDEDINLLFLLVQTIVLVVLSVIVRFCCIFWRKEKLKNNGLRGFLKKRRFLHNKKKELNKLISKLEQKAIEDATKNETLEDLGQIVKRKEGIEKKLNSCYSLGRDYTVSSGAVPSILPLFNGKMKSHSFQNSRQKESITIFDTLSDSSSVEERKDNESGYSGSSSSGWETENPEVEIQEVGEDQGEIAETSRVYSNPRDQGEIAETSRVYSNPRDQGEIAETSRVYSNPIYNEIEMDLAGVERKLGLTRRTNSSTY